MRHRPLILFALLALPSGASAQGIRLPHPPSTTPTEPGTGTPSPQIPVVARALAVKRSRWSAEGYMLFSSVQMPAPTGGTMSYTTVGAGTHGDYRFTDRFSATIDLTGSPVGSPALTATAEAGARFAPLPLSEDFRGLRPFFDVRAVYMHMYDTFAEPLTGGASGVATQAYSGSRYGRGFGSVGGAGVELPITSSVALTTEATAMRNRMTTYRLTSPTSLPTGNNYWMTSFRYALGLKYSPRQSMPSKPTP